MSRLLTVDLDDDNPKYRGCNWRAGRLYAVAETPEAALAGGQFLCSRLPAYLPSLRQFCWPTYWRKHAVNTRENDLGELQMLFGIWDSDDC